MQFYLVKSEQLKILFFKPVIQPFFFYNYIPRKFIFKPQKSLFRPKTSAPIVLFYLISSKSQQEEQGQILIFDQDYQTSPAGCSLKSNKD